MVQLLFILAIFLIGFAIFAPILGVIPFTWIGLILCLIIAILCIALANILGNQEEILSKLQEHDDRQRRLLPAKTKVCTKCNNSYDFDYKSCPKCGNMQD